MTENQKQRPDKKYGRRDAFMFLLYAAVVAVGAGSAIFVFYYDSPKDYLVGLLSFYAAVGVFFLLCTVFGVCRFSLREADRGAIAKILDNIAAAVAVTDKKGRFIYGNNAYRQLAGMPLRTPEILLARDREAAKAAYRLNCAAKERRSLQEILRFKRSPFLFDKEIGRHTSAREYNAREYKKIWALFSKTNKKTFAAEEGGAVEKEQEYCCRVDVRPLVLGGRNFAVWTITETESDARKSESMHRLQDSIAHFDTAPFGLLSWDKKGRVVFFNAGLARLLMRDFSQSAVDINLEDILGQGNAEKALAWAQRNLGSFQNKQVYGKQESSIGKVGGCEGGDEASEAAVLPLTIHTGTTGAVRAFYLYANGDKVNDDLFHALLIPQFALLPGVRGLSSATDIGQDAAEPAEAETGAHHAEPSACSTLSNGSVDIQQYFYKSPIALAVMGRNLRYMQSNERFDAMFALITAENHVQTGFFAENGEQTGEPSRQQRGAAEISLAEQNIVRFFSTMDKQEQRRVLQFIEAAFHDRNGQTTPLDIVLSGGDSRYVRLYATSVDTGGVHQGAIIISAVEITTQRVLEQQIEHSQKMQAVGQLAGGIAHDFNNVLTAIIMSCDLLLGNHRSSDPSYPDIINIKNNADRAAALVRQLLAFSRRQTLRPEILDLTDMLADLRMLLLRLAGNSIHLHIVHGQGLWGVLADQAELERVIMNLVSNARDAMPSGGEITIRTQNITAEESRNLPYRELIGGDYVRIDVADTGSGIAPEIMEKIFDPFFTTKEAGKGTGLGLSMVYGIVNQTGGHIYCRSIVGAGTVFSIYLPRHVQSAQNNAGYSISAADTAETDAVSMDNRAGDANSDHAMPTLSQSNRQNRQRFDSNNTMDLSGSANVLLVEDEEAVRMGGVKALQSRGYTVFEAESGIDALQIIKEQNGAVDIVVSDVVMPEMDGPTLLKELRHSYPHIKFIFVSGYAQEAFAKNLPADADFTFLAKPFSLKALAKTVKEALEENKMP